MKLFYLIFPALFTFVILLFFSFLRSSPLTFYIATELISNYSISGVFVAASDSLQKTRQKENAEEIKKKGVKENGPLYYWDQKYFDKREEYKRMKREKRKIQVVNGQGTLKRFLFY